MMVTDPEGFYIGKDSLPDLNQNLFPATYTENAANDSVYISHPKPGTYTVLIYSEKTPKASGPADDPKAAAYDLGIRIDGSFETVISGLQAHGGPRVLGFDTGQETLDQIVDAVFAALNLEDSGSPPRTDALGTPAIIAPDRLRDH